MHLIVRAILQIWPYVNNEPKAHLPARAGHTSGPTWSTRLQTKRGIAASMLSSSGCGAENTPTSRVTWKSLGQTGIYLWAQGVIFCGGFFFSLQKLCLDLQYDASSNLMGNLEADRQSKRVRLSSVMKNGVLLLRSAV